ncbi:hypothetical protein MD484_g5080, partial [Candolleomyces efflorescens]
MKNSGLLLASMLPFAMAFEYRVGVGKDETTGRKGLGFDPSVIHPAAGDTITFEFRSGSHSAVQSSFDNPCVGNGGFNSGVHEVPDSLAVDAPGLPVVTVTVNNTEPLWFFDEAGGLCHQGAVLAVNPTAAQSATIFKENAALPPKPASSTSAPASSSTTTAAANDSVTRPANSASGLVASGWLATAAGVVLGGLFM